METETMGRVTVKARIENLGDLYHGASSGAFSRGRPIRGSRRRTGRHRGNFAVDAQEVDRTPGTRTGPNAKSRDERGACDAFRFTRPCV